MLYRLLWRKFNYPNQTRYTQYFQMQMGGGGQILGPCLHQGRCENICTGSAKPKVSDVQWAHRWLQNKELLSVLWSSQLRLNVPRLQSVLHNLLHTGMKSCVHGNCLQNTQGKQEFLQFSQTKNKDAYHSMKVSKHKFFWTEGEMWCQSSDYSHMANNFFTHTSVWMPSCWPFDPKVQSQLRPDSNSVITELLPSSAHSSFHKGVPKADHLQLAIACGWLCMKPYALFTKCHYFLLLSRGGGCAASHRSETGCVCAWIGREVEVHQTVGHGHGHSWAVSSSKVV